MMLKTACRFRQAITVIASVLLAGLAPACQHKESASAGVAVPSVTVSRSTAPLGSPLDITYKFVVANDARFDENYQVMLHVVDKDGGLLWTDDHKPALPTTAWRPGQTIEYTRTVWVPLDPYLGQTMLQVGLYSLTSQKRLSLTGEDVGHHAYKVGTLELLPMQDALTVFKDGWNNQEVAPSNPSLVWHWTKKQATLAFTNPKRDAVLYLDIRNPPDVFTEPQQVQMTIGGQRADGFTVTPGVEVLRRIPLRADQLGGGDVVEVQLDIDKTFVPAKVAGGRSTDPRELGVCVFHAFLLPAQ